MVDVLPMELPMELRDPYPCDRTCPSCGQVVHIPRFGHLQIKCPCGKARYRLDYGWIYTKRVGGEGTTTTKKPDYFKYLKEWWKKYGI